MKGMLVLEDGSCFEGLSIGAAGERTGELVFHTSVTGYQELLTDPANAGKIIILTYPLIGNYGTAEKFSESGRVWPSGLLIKEESRIMSNYMAETPFRDFIKKQGLITLSKMETRTLALTIRDKGPLTGIISTRKTSKAEMLKKLKGFDKDNKKEWIRKISVKKITKISAPGAKRLMAVLDLGCPQSLIRQLKILKCHILLLPYNTPARKILSLRPDGLIISSGPENDTAFPEIARTAAGLLGRLPVLGIQAGHEIIALALGAKVKRMKRGHHGVNYPVLGDASFKGDITVQNHGYAVDGHSLKSRKDVRITMKNLNDCTIEEMESRKLKFLSVQYMPAAGECRETSPVLKRFLDTAGKRRGA